MTGLTFLLVSEVGNKDSPALLKEIYIIYADFVSKDPFYTVFNNDLAWSTDQKYKFRFWNCKTYGINEKLTKIKL